MTTTAFEDGGVIPAKFVGQMGVSPELKWSQVPMGTQSFVLLFHDPEPVLQKGLMDVTHWLVWNIPATSTGLPEGVMAAAEAPDGMRQVSLRSNGYRGPVLRQVRIITTLLSCMHWRSNWKRRKPRARRLPTLARLSSLQWMVTSWGRLFLRPGSTSRAEANSGSGTTNPEF